MADIAAQETGSPLSVSLNPRAARDRDRPLVLGVFSFRHDAHLVPGLIENIGPMVDGWVSWDDRASDSPFGDESRRRKALLEAAVEHGAGWILAVDPAERIESALAGRIRDLVRAEGLVAYELRLRAMFSVTEYRVDGAWDLFGARRLFSIRRGFSDDRVAFADPRAGFGDYWYPGQVPYGSSSRTSTSTISGPRRPSGAGCCGRCAPISILSSSSGRWPTSISSIVTA